MTATTEQKARLFGLMVGLGELVRDCKRDPEQVSEILQIIKDDRNFAARLLDGRQKDVKSSLLEPVGMVPIPATTEKFTFLEKFVVNGGGKGLPKISWLGSNFEEWFLKKTEGPMSKTTLCYAKLVRRSVDGPIIDSLGGEEKAETYLSNVSRLMVNQPNGENGVLLNNGYANIFYVRDVSLVLRAVHVCWFGHGWYVYAYSIDHPSAWYGNHQVFSRDS
jgi:hypothetical protein